VNARRNSSGSKSLETLLEQLREDPAVGRIGGRVEYGHADRAVVGLVEEPLANRRAIGQRRCPSDQYLGTDPANLAGDVAAQVETGLHDPVRAAEEGHVVDGDDRGARPLLPAPHRAASAGRRPSMPTSPSVTIT
jgi:hypothetical protein